MPSNSTNNTAVIHLHWLVGLAIGKGGENIKGVRRTTGANIRYDEALAGFVITGTALQVRHATTEMKALIDQIKQRGDYKQKAAEAAATIKAKREMQNAWKLFCEKLDDDGFPLHSAAELKKLKPKFFADLKRKTLEKELEMGFYATHHTGLRRPRAAGSAAGGSAAAGSAADGSAAAGLWCRAVAGGSATGGSTAPTGPWRRTSTGGSATAAPTEAATVATEATTALLERVANAEAKAAKAEAKVAEAEAKVAEDKFKAFLERPVPDCWDDE